MMSILRIYFPFFRDSAFSSKLIFSIKMIASSVT